MSPIYDKNNCYTLLPDLYEYVSVFISTNFNDSMISFFKSFACKRKTLGMCNIDKKDIQYTVSNIQNEFIKIDLEFFKYCSIEDPEEYKAKIDYYYDSIMKILESLHELYNKYFKEIEYMNTQFATFEITVQKYVEELKQRDGFVIENYFSPISNTSYIVNENDKGYIKNIYKLSQHKIEYRLFTNAGELHQLGFECCDKTKPTFSISEYCIDRLKSNPKCIVLLEYDYNIPKQMRHLIGSEVIQDIFKANLNDELLSRIKGVDSRWKFLGLDHNKQNILYCEKSFKNIYKNNKQKWLNDYINIFDPQRLSNEITCVQGVLNQRLSQYLYTINEFWLNLKAEFEKSKQEDVNILWTKTRELWAFVMDFEVLKIIFSDTNNNEFVSVLGMNHQENLDNVMNKLLVNESQLVTKPIPGYKCNCIQYKALKKI